MKSINLMDSEIPQIFTINLEERYGYTWWSERTGDIYNVVFSTIAAFLKRNSSKNDSTTGVCIKNADGNFIIAAVLTYTPPEEGDSDDKGNFSLEFVTSEEEYRKLNVDHDLNDYEKEIYVISEHYAWDMANGRWKSVQIMWSMFAAAIDTLKSFIFRNLDSGEPIEVTLPGVFTAMGDIEDDIKQFAIVPAGAIKQIIKNDVVL